MILQLSLALAAAPSPETLGDAIATEGSKRSGGHCTHAEGTITCEGGRSVLSLANLHLEYQRATPTERALLFETWVQQLTSPPVSGTLTPSEIRERLRPLVKSATELRLLQLETRLRGAEATTLQAPLTETLRLVLAIDSPTTMEFARPDLLSQAELTIPEAMELARTNLEATPGAIEQIGPGVYVSASGDGYDCARVLSPKRLKALGIVGDPVVLLLARDRAFATSASNVNGMAFLLRAAASSMNEELVRPVSLVPLIHQSGRWTDLTLADDHPAAGDLDNLRRLQRGQWYFEQHQALDAIHAQTQDAVFTSKLSGFRGPRGLIFVATLESGTTLLPVADYVTLVDADQVPRLLPWKEFLRLAGERAVPEAGSAPPLFRVDGAAIYADLTPYAKVWLSIEQVMKP